MLGAGLLDTSFQSPNDIDATNIESSRGNASLMALYTNNQVKWPCPIPYTFGVLNRDPLTGNVLPGRRLAPDALAKVFLVIYFVVQLVLALRPRNTFLVAIRLHLHCATYFESRPLTKGMYLSTIYTLSSL